jgi:hypothetical protein
MIVLEERLGQLNRRAMELERVTRRNRVAEAFDSDIFSEYEPQFWGFDTQEEWDAWHEDNRKDEDECYADLLRFLADQPNNIGAGTVREEQAQIAKRLVSEDPTLVSPNRRKEFIEEIRTAYDNSRKVVVCMEPKDDADLAAMTAAVEKHCPQGFTVIARRRR